MGKLGGAAIGGGAALGTAGILAPEAVGGAVVAGFSAVPWASIGSTIAAAAVANPVLAGIVGGSLIIAGVAKYFQKEQGMKVEVINITDTEVNWEANPELALIVEQNRILSSILDATGGEMREAPSSFPMSIIHFFTGLLGFGKEKEQKDTLLQQLQFQSSILTSIMVTVTVIEDIGEEQITISNAILNVSDEQLQILFGIDEGVKTVVEILNEVHSEIVSASQGIITSLDNIDSILQIGQDWSLNPDASLENYGEQMVGLLTDISGKLDNVEQNNTQINVIVQPIVEAIREESTKALEASRSMIEQLMEANVNLQLLAPQQWGKNSGHGGQIMSQEDKAATAGMSTDDKAAYGRAKKARQKAEAEAELSGEQSAGEYSPEDLAFDFGTQPQFTQGDLFQANVYEHDIYNENPPPEHHEEGEWVSGQPGVGENEDNVRARLTKGEFVVRKRAAQKHKALLEDINADHMAAGGWAGHYAVGGEVVAAFGPLLAAAMPGLAAFGAALTAAVPALAALAPAVVVAAGSLYILKTGFDAVSAVVAAVTSGLSIIIGILVGVGNALGALAAAPLGILAAGLGAVNEVMGKLASGDVYGAIASVSQMVVGAFSKVGDVLIGWVPVIGTFFGGLVSSIQSVIGGFATFMSQMTPFVEKISPAIVEQWNRSVAGLQATIGIAFTGIMQTMTDMVWKFGGILLPIAEELQPLFADLGALIEGTLLPVFKVFATGIQTAIGPIRTAFEALKPVIIDVVKSFIILAAIVARALGANDFLARLQQNLERPDRAGAIASGPVAISGFEAIMKEVSQAAAQASVSGQGGGPASEIDILTDVLAEIRAIRGEDLDALGNRITDMWNTFTGNIQRWWDAMVAQIMAFFGPAGTGGRVLLIVERVALAMERWVSRLLDDRVAPERDDNFGDVALNNFRWLNQGGLGGINLGDPTFLRELFR